jgi:hypothetical protein
MTVRQLFDVGLAIVNRMDGQIPEGRDHLAAVRRPLRRPIKRKAVLLSLRGSVGSPIILGCVGLGYLVQVSPIDLDDKHLLLKLPFGKPRYAICCPSGDQAGEEAHMKPIPRSLRSFLLGCIVNNWPLVPW